MVSSGTIGDITFTLNADDGWFVSAQSGEIFGQFSAVGTHNMTLYAVDHAGKQAVVEVMTFDVKARPIFSLLAEGFDPSTVRPEEVGLPPNTAPPTQEDAATPLTVQYAIGSTIKFPPLQASASELFSNPASGDYSRIVYKRTFGDGAGTNSNNANNGNNNVNTNVTTTTSTSPGLWLVDTETAEMLAQPEHPGNYSVRLVATDGGGAEVVFRKWSFEVLLKDTDVPEYGPNGRDCHIHGERVDDANIFDNAFACDCTGTGYNGDNCEVKIQPTVCRSNEALGDGICRPFQLAVNQDGTRTADGPEFTNPTAMQEAYYTVRDFASYRIAPLAIDAKRTNYSSGNHSDVTYTMVGDSENFFLNTKTGQMLGTFDNFLDDAEKASTKSFSITVQAIDKSGVNQDLETIQMNVRYPDLEVAEYGPNSMPCQNNGTRMDGFDGNGDMFDQSYVCACIRVGKTTYSGDNCEIETVDVVPQASTAEGTGNIPLVTGATAGAFIFIFCVGLIIYKRKMYKFKMKAFDFKAEVLRLIGAGEIDETEEGSENTVTIPREIKRANITMTQQIGEGAFGDVWKGILDESSAG